MSIEKRTRGYEILIRLNADGTIGAHYATISEVVEDGQVIAASPPELTPLGSVEGDNARRLEEILGGFSVSIISANEHLTSTITKLNEKCDVIESSLADEKIKASALERELSETRLSLTEKLQALTASRDALAEELSRYRDQTEDSAAS